LFAPSASALRCPVVTCPEQVTTAHFRVHFNSDAGGTWRINVIQAHEVATYAERAYATYVGLGFAPPLADGDGDGYNIYVVDLVAGAYEPWGRAAADNPAALTSSGHIELDAIFGIDEHKVAHLVFHLFQHSAWNQMDLWMREAGAEWAAFHHLGFPLGVISVESNEPKPLVDFLGKPELPLDCPAEPLSGAQCGDEFYELEGRSNYPHWAFLTYAAERFGSAFVKDVIDRSVANGDPAVPTLELVSDALIARGATLADVFNDWTVVQMTGGYKALGLKGAKPTPLSTTITGGENGAIPIQKVGVAHLSTRFLAFERGTGSMLGPCHAATLSLSVALPFGVGARPYFYWTGGLGDAIPLAVQGSTATLSVPWDTCTWPNEKGLLALPNPSRTLNAQDFVVSGSLTVDPSTIVTATAPPAGSYTGPTIPAPLTDEPPSIAVYGPELLRVSRKSRVLRLVIFSSGLGKLEAKLGSGLLGTRTLRTGNNDLRFKLPRTALRTLNARGKLTLTSLSPSGISGATVKRNVTLTK
jgi:hypothetical protein